MLDHASFGSIGPFLKFLDLFKGGIILVDESAKILGINQLLLDQLGYDQEEAQGLTLFEVNPHLTLLKWRNSWRKLKEGEKMEETTEFISAQNILFPVRTESVFLKTGDLVAACLLVENLMETNRYKDLLNITSKVSRVGCWELDYVQQQAIITREAQDILNLNLQHEHFTFQEASNLLQTLFKAEDFDRLLRLSQRSIHDGQPFELEAAITSNARHKSVIDIRGLPHFSEEKASKLYGTIQDISSLSARSEDLYISRFVLENMRDLIFWVKPNGHIFYANDIACSTLHTTREIIKQSHLSQWLPSVTRDNWPQTWDALRSDRVLESATQVKPQQGDLIPVEASHHYLTYDDEAFNCLIVRNLTFKQQRDELIEMVHFTLNQSSDLIFWARRDGSILYFNESVPSTLGYRRDYLKQATLFDLNPDLSRESYEWLWAQMVADGKLKQEYRYYRADGSTFMAEAVATHIQYHQQECCCITMRDISHRVEKERALEKALQEIQKLKEKAESQKTYLQEEVTSTYNFNNIISKSKNYRRVLKQVTQVADTRSTVLIQGETGTGKELLARAIHGMSDRDESPLVKVNCAALPAELIESELFGHEKGAFTGAFQRKIGKFELADGGTIFLDEIGEMPLELQAKLLRVLQEGEFERVGDPLTRTTDVRVIAATNRNLEAMVQNGNFREDLYFRLNVFPIYNLPLRERKEDIPLLIQHFLNKYNQRSGKTIKKIDQAAVQKLMRYEFPGNIRELENLVERAVIISDGDELDLDSILPTANSPEARLHHFPTLEEMEKKHILDALSRTQGRITGDQGAARLLGLKDKTLASRMRKWGIQRMDFLKHT